MSGPERMGKEKGRTNSSPSFMTISPWMEFLRVSTAAESTCFAGGGGSIS